MEVIIIFLTAGAAGAIGMVFGYHLGRERCKMDAENAERAKHIEDMRKVIDATTGEDLPTVETPRPDPNS